MSGWMIVVDRLTDLPAAVRRLSRDDRPRLHHAAARDAGARCPRSSTCRAATATRRWATTARCWPRRAGTRWCRRSPPCSSSPGAPPTSMRWPSSRRRSTARIRRLADPPTASFRLLVCLGQCDDPRFARFGRQLFDWFRCPILEVFVKAGETWRIRKLAPVAITELGEAGKDAARGGDPGPCPPALEVAARQGAAPVHARRPARPEGEAAAIGPARPSATSSGSPRAWAWASR